MFQGMEMKFTEIIVSGEEDDLLHNRYRCKIKGNLQIHLLKCVEEQENRVIMHEEILAAIHDNDFKVKGYKELTDA